MSSALPFSPKIHGWFGELLNSSISSEICLEESAESSAIPSGPTGRNLPKRESAFLRLVAVSS